MNKFIIRVDDVGQLPDQSQPDVGLRFFKSWHRACAWGDTPMYLGVVPGVLEAEDIALAYEHVQQYGGEVCIHGYDHARGVLSSKDVLRAANLLPGARCVIPPYNMYDEMTLEATAHLGNKPVLFGGLPRDHKYGSQPTLVRGALHVAAEPSLYVHSYALMSALAALPNYDHPIVMTFHHRWDHAELNQAAKVAAKIRRHVVEVNAAWDWYEAQNGPQDTDHA